MKIKTILIIGILCITLLTGCDKMTLEEKNNFCKEDCNISGYNFGKYIGYAHCNCYNLTVNNKSVVS